MAKRKSEHPHEGPCPDAKGQVLAVFADYAAHDVEQLVDFLYHCQIDLEPFRAKKAELPDIIAAHFYIRPGVYDIDRLAELLVTFPPMAAQIREMEAESAARGLA
jgi:hypothetical protein